MASPPKPWERPGASAAASSTYSLSRRPLRSGVHMLTTCSPIAPILSTTAASPAVAASTAAASSAAPPVPDRPSSLTSAVNQNASAYSRVGAMGMGASPYSAYGSAYSSPYSSPYSRFGGMGGYGGGMYGGYGGYGGGMYGGMYGGGMGPNDPNSLTNRFSNGTAATFQMLEGIVTAFGGFAQMLESTYMATHSSFFGMLTSHTVSHPHLDITSLTRPQPWYQSPSSSATFAILWAPFLASSHSYAGSARSSPKSRVGHPQQTQPLSHPPPLPALKAVLAPMAPRVPPRLLVNLCSSSSPQHSVSPISCPR